MRFIVTNVQLNEIGIVKSNDCVLSSKEPKTICYLFSKCKGAFTRNFFPAQLRPFFFCFIDLELARAGSRSSTVRRAELHCGGYCSRAII